MTKAELIICDSSRKAVNVDGLHSENPSHPVFVATRNFTLRHVQSPYDKVHEAIVHTIGGTYVAKPGEAGVKVEGLGTLSHDL